MATRIVSVRSDPGHCSPRLAFSERPCGCDLLLSFGPIHRYTQAERHRSGLHGADGDPGERCRQYEYTTDDVEAFTLSVALDDGPVVLAFFPGAFSRTCTQELYGFRDWRQELGDLDTQVTV